MTRIAIIGSSHVAALKLAWDDLQHAYPDLEVDFFSMARGKFEQAYLRPDRSFGLPKHLRARLDLPKNARRLLDLSTFDHVWHVGSWQIRPNGFNQIIQLFNIDGLPATTHLHWMSQATYRACLDAFVQAALPTTDWHHWDSPKVWYSGFPRRNAHQSTRTLFQEVDLRNHKACWDDAEALFDTHMTAAGITWVPQPKETLDAYGFTMQHFGTDKPDPSGDKVDIAHMNASFGALMWDAFLARSLA